MITMIMVIIIVVIERMIKCSSWMRNSLWWLLIFVVDLLEGLAKSTNTLFVPLGNEQSSSLSSFLYPLKDVFDQGIVIADTGPDRLLIINAVDTIPSSFPSAHPLSV